LHRRTGLPVLRVEGMFAVAPVECTGRQAFAKPFEPRKLVRDLLRLMDHPQRQEHRPPARPPLKMDGVELDREQPSVRLRLHDGWRTVDLPWTEHRLLTFLLSGAGKAHSRKAIRDAVWHDAPGVLRTVDQSIRRLRRRLEGAGARERVKTVSGVGYRLDLAVLKRGAPDLAAPSRVTVRRLARDDATDASQGRHIATRTFFYPLGKP
jgi:DNA-binding response OmpR family regulator